MAERPRLLPALAAAAGGTLVFGFVEVVLAPGWHGPEVMLRERAFTIAVGNLAAAWLAVLVCALLGRRPTPPAAWLIGSGIALASLAAPALPAAAATGPLLAALAAAAALRLGPAFQPPRRLLFAAGGLAVLLPVLIALAPGELRPLPVEPPPPLPPAPPGPAPAPGRPDVVLIVADTLRADVAVDPSLPTPNLDRLRQGGLWARAVAAPANQTLPSHLALLTGLRIEKTGMRSNRSPWPPAALLDEVWGMRTLAQRFAAAGWRTAAVAANPLLSVVPPGAQDFAEGFEVWDPQQVIDPWWELLAWKDKQCWYGWLVPLARLRPAANFALRRTIYRQARFFYRPHVREGERTAAAALARIEELAAGDRPYFLFVNFYDPHTPYIAPPPFAGSESNAVVPRGYRNAPLDDFPARKELRAEIARVGGEGGERGRELGAFLRARYREEVRYFDQQLGRLLAGIEATGRPTLVLFTGDHGEMFGEHGSVEHSRTLFEGEMTVPLILAGPGVPAGRELREPAELTDAAFTLLELAGVSTAGADGRNLLAPAGAAAPPALSVMAGAVAVRDGRWKLHLRVSWPHGGTEPVLEPAGLYDLAADPGETRDLADRRPAELARLLAVARSRLADDLLPRLPERRLDAAEERRLSGLGYTGDADG